MPRLTTFLDSIRRLFARQSSHGRADTSAWPTSDTPRETEDDGHVTDVQSAIIDHLEWCRAFSEHLASHSVLPGQAPAPTHPPQNRLGLWIQRTELHSRVGQHPAYGALKEEHRRCHSLAEQALSLARANRMDQASTLLNTDFERSRVRVIELLRAIQRS